MSVGFVCAAATGAGMPSMVFLMGDIVNSFQATSILDAVKTTIITLAIIGCVVWVITYVYFVSLVVMAERVGKKTRVHYLHAILKQDIAWFDSMNVPELSARLSKECQAIQKALGEKMGQILLGLGMSFSGLFFAFFRGWIMSLILFAAFPVMLIMMVIVGKAIQSGFRKNLEAYG